MKAPERTALGFFVSYEAINSHRTSFVLNAPISVLSRYAACNCSGYGACRSPLLYPATSEQSLKLAGVHTPAKPRAELANGSLYGRRVDGLV